MRVNTKRIMARLEEIYACGAQTDGTHTRMVFSKEDLKARELFTEWADQLGMSQRVDEAGNLIVRMEGKRPYAPAIIMGSHMDTVPDGGKYDGVVGCVAGLEVCEAMKEAAYIPEHPIEVIVFTDEEGFRFGKGLLGSSAFCGQDPDIIEEEMDIYGNLRCEVMKAYGINCTNVPKAKREKDSVKCFLELHVEQGATLDKTDCSIGIVSSIAGVNRYEVTIYGEANHAGSTAMSDRKDALVSAAAFICQVPDIVKSYGNDFSVATVGTIKVTPHSVNVIPGTCTFSLEIRDQKDEIMTLLENKLHDKLKEVCNKEGLDYSFTPISYHEPAPMCDWVKEEIERAIRNLGYEYITIPSGAFHDSLIMAGTFPTGMIFVPSVNGISHSREEYTKEKDIEKGCNVLLETILNIDVCK